MKENVQNFFILIDKHLANLKVVYKIIVTFLLLKSTKLK